MGQPFSVCCQGDGARPPSSDLLPKPGSNSELLRSTQDPLAPTTTSNSRGDTRRVDLQATKNVGTVDVWLHPASISTGVAVSGSSAHPASFIPDPTQSYPSAPSSLSSTTPTSDLFESSAAASSLSLTLTSPSRSCRLDLDAPSKALDVTHANSAPLLSELKKPASEATSFLQVTFPTQYVESPTSIHPPSLSSRDNSRNNSVSSLSEGGNQVNTPEKTLFRSSNGKGNAPPARGWVQKKRIKSPLTPQTSLTSLD